RLGKAAEGRRSYARRQVPGYEPEGKTSRGRVRERATRGRRSKISEVQNQISVRFLLAEVRISLASGHLSEPVGELPPPVAYMPRSWQPLKVLIVAEQALTSLVRCACLSLIRAKSCRDQIPKRPVMQSRGITLSFYREMADSSRELIGPDVSAAIVFESY